MTLNFGCASGGKVCMYTSSSSSKQTKSDFQVYILLQWWKDARLSWDPSSFGQVEDLRVSPSRIWKPDLRLYSSSV